METKYVTKRNGEKQALEKNKIKERLAGLTEGLNKDMIDLDIVVEKVWIGTYPGKKFLTFRHYYGRAGQSCC